MSEYIELITKYAGVKKRRCDVLSNKNLLTRGTKTLMNLFKNNDDNVFCRYKSLLSVMLEKIIDGEPVQFLETINESNVADGTVNLVFSFGGITMQEYRECRILGNKTGKTIVVGGTMVHNSRRCLIN